MTLTLILFCIAVFLVSLYYYRKHLKKETTKSPIPLIILASLVSLVLFSGYIFNQIQTIEKNHDKKTILLFELHKTSKILKQSSNDLTKMVRNYIITGEEKYKKYYNTILDIRAGKVERPENYDKIYWDYVVATGNSPTKSLEKLPFLNLLDPLELRENERVILENALQKSNQLANFEVEAINASEGTFKDANGKFTIKKRPNRKWAINKLYGPNYLDIKKGIMILISRFITTVEERYNVENELLINEKSFLTRLLITMVFAGILLVVSLVIFTYSEMKETETFKSPSIKEGRLWSIISKHFKHTWQIILVAISTLALIISLTLINKRSIDTQTKKILHNSLKTVLHSSSDSLNKWFEQERKNVFIWSQKETIINNTQKLSRLKGQKKKLIKSPATQFIKKELSQLTKLKLLKEFILISKNGTILAWENNTKKVGQKVTSTRERSFLNGILSSNNKTNVLIPRADTKTFKSTNQKYNNILIGSSVKNKNDETIGFLIFSYDPEGEFTRILQRGRIGRSGETYAFDKNGIMLSLSRFENELRKIGLIGKSQKSIFNIKLNRQEKEKIFSGELNPLVEGKLTKMATSATNGLSSYDMNGYNDYRGTKVVGAWLWNDIYNFGVTTELDFSEAYLSLHNSSNAIDTITFITIGLIILLTIMFVIWKSKTEESQLKTKNHVEALRSIATGVIITNPKAIIEWANPAFEQMTGYKLNEIVGKSMKIFNSGEHTKDFFANMWNKISEGKKWEGLLLNKKKNGQKYYEEISITPVFNQHGAIANYVAIKKDITERKKAEIAINKAKIEAENAAKSKAEFLANMSHEIRTPMNAIIGLSDLCLRTNLNPKQEDYLNKILLSSKNLLGIINDILDFSKIESGKLTLEKIPFNIDEVLDNLATVISVKAMDKRLELLFSRDQNVPAHLIGDPLRLGQVLINLCNNAVKFTEQGDIVVGIILKETQDNNITLKFNVSDTGIGITEEQQKKMFKSFSQADTSTTRKYGGTGLGLSISKQIVELMDGKIWVESQYGVGSNFYFEVNLEIDSNNFENIEYIPPEQIKDMKALVIDDNDHACEIAKTYLENIGLQVTVKQNALDGINLLESSKEPFDLVLLDYIMPPGIDGIEAAKRISNSKLIPNTPLLILVTSRGLLDFDQTELQIFDAKINKPLNPSLIFDTLMKVLQIINPIQNSSKTHKKILDHRKFENIRGAKILLVEDIKLNQQVATEILTYEGFKVDVANNGKEAINMIENGDYECVLMDIQMPIMDGLTASKMIRQNKKYDTLPIIAMTANAMERDKQQAIEHGMNDHVAKPIDKTQLFKSLFKHIEHKKRDFTLPDNNNKNNESGIKLHHYSKIDTKKALQNLNNDKTFFLKVLSDFYTDHQDSAIQIKEFNKSANYDDAKRISHSLKGISATLAIKTINKISKELEESFDNTEHPKRDNLIDELAIELNSFFDEIAPTLENKETKRIEEKMSSKELEHFLNKITELIEQMDPEAEDYILNKYEQLKKTIGQDNSSQLKDKIANFDFENAQNLIKEIKSKIQQPKNE